MSPTGMDTIKELSDDIFRERLLRAHAMDPTEKFLLGQRLFESACEVTKSGIRFENPDASEVQVRANLRRRLEWKERWEEMQCKTVPPLPRLAAE